MQMMVLYFTLCFIFGSSFRQGIQAQPTKIQVVSEPGIAVFVDGTYRGKTSPGVGGLVIQNVQPGNHTIKVTREGFIPQEEKIFVKQGEVYKYSVKSFTAEVEITQMGSVDTRQKELMDENNKVLTEKPITPAVTYKKVEDVSAVQDDVVLLELEQDDKPSSTPMADDASASLPESDDEPAFVFVEEPALFQGGDLNAFREWVQKSLVYPPEALEKGISGRIIAQFAVNSKGDVVDIRVLRGVDPALDNEALRVLQSSPRWQPPRQGGKPVKQQFVIPVVFAP